MTVPATILRNFSRTIQLQRILALGLTSLSSVAIGQTNSPTGELPAQPGVSAAVQGPVSIESQQHHAESCPRCQSGANCVPGISDYPAFQRTYGNPYRIMDCRNDQCESSVLDRWKRSMQASHWGYPENFHQNSFGSSQRNAFSNNIRDGAIERSTLYLMDFYPEDSSYPFMLTPKGLERLEKAICVSNTLGSPLKFEKSTRPEINEMRRQWLSEHPLVAAAGIPISNIQMNSKPIGIQGTEAIYRLQRGLSPSNSQPTQSGVGGGISSAGAPGMLPGSGMASGPQTIR